MPATPRRGRTVIPVPSSEKQVTQEKSQVPIQSGFPKVIAITLCRRPEATRKLFGYLEKCIGIENYTLIIGVDIDPNNRQASEEVYGIATDWCNSWSTRVPTFNDIGNWKIELHDPYLGVDLNKLDTLQTAYKYSDYVIFLNDDTPISPDGLLFFEWAGEKFKDDQSIYSICGYNRVTDQEANQIDPWAYTFGAGDGIWGFARWRDRHEATYGIDGSKYIEYCKEHGHAINGWFDAYAAHIATQERTLKHVKPLLARTQHSEWESAEHTPTADGGEWFRNNEYNPVWAGILTKQISAGEWHYVSDKPLLNIYIDCAEGGFSAPWYPGSFSGGSENQTIILAQELAKQGHTVTVRNNCGRDNEGVYVGSDHWYEFHSQLPAGGVKYIDYQNWASPTPVDNIDVYCSFRNPHTLRGPRVGRVQVLLCHDIPHSSHFPNREQIAEGWLDGTDIVMALNEYHKRLYLDYGCPEDKLQVCPIFIELDEFPRDVERIPGRCIYCSCPDRGLRVLLEKWPEIKQRNPEATLQICWNVPIIRDWFQYSSGNEDLGILPPLYLQHADLGRELCKASLLTYPSTFAPEISPAATIKAQIAGAVPVVVLQGGMVETVVDGFRVNYDGYVNAVTEALAAPGWQEAVRELWIPQLSEKYKASRAAEVWVQHVYTQLRKDKPMTQDEFDSGWLGGKETSKLFPITDQYCQGYGADFGCELDPHPNATVLVDNQQIVHQKFMGHGQPTPLGIHAKDPNFRYQVHIREIENLFPDWEDNILDFTYSSHMIEHIRDPRAFLTECARITKPGGNVVVVGPHEDWYWPVTHPDANPDHTKYNWSLNQERVGKWMKAVGLEVIHSSEHGWGENNHSFLVVGQVPSSSSEKQVGRK